MNDPVIFARRERLWLLALFGGGLVLRCAHVWTIRASPFFEWLMLDPRMYDEWARQIVAGAWWGDRPFFQDPLYPYLLALVYRVVGQHYTPVVLLQSLAGATVAPLLFSAARRMLGFRAAAIAGLLAATYLPSIYYEGMILKTSLAMWLVTIGFWLIERRSARQGPVGVVRERMGWAIVGVVFALAALARGNLLLFVPVLVCWILVEAPAGSSPTAGPRARLADRRVLTSALVFVVGAGLVIGAVAVRNRAVGGEWILTTSNAGQNFYLGNNPANTTGQYEKLSFVDANPQHEEQGFAREAEGRARRDGQLAPGETMRPGDVSRYWFGESLAWMRAEPTAWAHLTWRKLRVFWGAYEVPDNLDYYLYRESAPVLRLPLPGFGFVAPLALLGAAFLWRRSGWTRALLLFVVVYSSSVVLFFVFSRFRLPMMPALFVFAGYAVTESWNRVQAVRKDRSPRGVRSAALTLAGLVALFAFVHVPVRAHPQSVAYRLAAALRLPRQAETSAQGRFNLGVSYAARAKTDEDASRLLALAEVELRAAIEAGMPYAAPHVELGKVLARQQRNRDAIASYRIAAELEPGDYRNHHAIGLLERRLDDPSAAAAAFGQALALEPRHVASAVQLGELLLDMGRHDEAAAAFRHALTVNPGSARARRGLAAAVGS